MILISTKEVSAYLRSILLLLFVVPALALAQGTNNNPPKKNPPKPAASTNTHQGTNQGHGNGGGSNSGGHPSGGGSNAPRSGGQAPHGNSGAPSGGNSGGGQHNAPASGGPSNSTYQQHGGSSSGGQQGGGQGGGQPAGQQGGSNTHTANGGNQNYRPPSNPNSHGNNNGPGAGPVSGTHMGPGSGSGPTRTVRTSSGNTFNYGQNGHVASVTTHTGTVAHFGPNGHVASIHTQNATIIHGPRGGRTIVSVHNNTRIVSFGANRGYVQNTFVRGGAPFMQRTYVMNGRVYAHVYRGFYWHGGLYYRYVPAYRFAPGYYGWAHRPWGISIGWGWGWGPWYPYYGYYFSPYPVYASPVFWLTDYILAAELEAAYQAQIDAQAQAQASENSGPPSDNSDQESSNNVTLSPEVKQAIADEVSAQLTAQQNSASSNPGGSSAAPSPDSDQLPAALDPNQRTFIVSTALDEQNSDGSACVLSPGDVLTRLTDTPDANGNVNVMVTSSQKGDCSSGDQFSISVQALQDMHNDFRQHVDDGLQKLSQSAGQNGMPAAPPAGQQPNASGQVTPDTKAAAELQSEQQEADQAESDVNQASSSGTNN